VLLKPFLSHLNEKQQMVKSLSRRFKHLALFAFSLVSIAGCEIINPSEEIPSYIHLNSFHLATSYGQGTSSHKITDVWVYVDDQFKGVYELPATIPLLYSGKHKLHLRPGVLLNGIASTRAIYPLFTSIILNPELKPGEVLYIDSISNGIINYHPDAIFPWNDRGQEDFEEGGISFDSTGNSQTTIKRVSDEVFEGNFSGLIELSSTIKTFEAKSTDEFDLPQQGTTTFIELNYKCNNSFFVGYYVNNAQGSGILRKVVEIFPKSTWNKMYVNLTPYVSVETNPQDFNIWIGATKNAGIEFPEIYIDNIKIVHY
jgi:hypothetical protein